MKWTRKKARQRKSDAAWSRLDHQLFRLNLCMYQKDPGEPPRGKGQRARPTL